MNGGIEGGNAPSENSLRSHNLVSCLLELKEVEDEIKLLRRTMKEIKSWS